MRCKCIIYQLEAETDRLKHRYAVFFSDFGNGYQLFHGGMDMAPEQFLTLHNSDQTPGHQWKLSKPRAATLSRRNTFSVWVVNDWNSLPETVSAVSRIF